MDFSEPQWRELVEAFTNSFEGLVASAHSVVPLGLDELDRGPAIELEATTDIHLANSQRIGAYLSDRIEDPDARQVLGRAALADLEAFQIVGSSTDEPDAALRGFQVIATTYDFEALRADLLGGPAIAGAADSQGTIETVEGACNEILERAEGCAGDLVTNVATSITVAQAIDGVGRLLGEGAAVVLKQAEAELRKWKRKAFRLLEEALAKIAKLLGVDEEKVTTELETLWKKMKDRATDWIEDVLGRARALSAWRAFVGTEPPPSPDRINAGLGVIERSKENHSKQLTWACRGVKVYGYVDNLVALIPQGPTVLLIVAGGLGGWLTWTTWDYLGEVTAAAS